MKSRPVGRPSGVKTTRYSVRYTEVIIVALRERYGKKLQAMLQKELQRIHDQDAD